MGFYIAQGGDKLVKLSTSGETEELTLPPGVTVDSTRRLRGTVLNGHVILVNSVSENLVVDRFGTVNILCPKPPSTALTVAATSGGSLTGGYVAWMTYYIKDIFGNIVAESDFSPASNTVTLSSQALSITAPTSSQQITGRRFYRSTSGPGEAKFFLLDLEDNTQTGPLVDALPDESLSLIAAPDDLGTPPDFVIVAQWRDRVWGVTATDPDNLYYSSVNKPYAFPPENIISVPPKRSDARGITGFLARKDALGVGKLGSFHVLTGSNQTGFNRVGIGEKIGVLATDSCVVIHDVGYFLGNPFGVYKWDAAGLSSISNDKVRAWFDTDDYFNRALFDQAVGAYYPDLNAYVLLLAGKESTSLDRWIMYDIGAKTWWGPHKTGAFTPTGVVTLQDADNKPMPVFLGSDGKLYKPQATKTDGTDTAIDFDVHTNWMSGGTPTIAKTFLQPTITSKKEAGGALTVTPHVGQIGASASASMTHDLTTGVETLPRIGVGEVCQLRLRQNTAGQGVVVYGIEIPYFEDGLRR